MCIKKQQAHTQNVGNSLSVPMPITPITTIGPLMGPIMTTTSTIFFISRKYFDIIFIRIIVMKYLNTYLHGMPIIAVKCVLCILNER